MSEVVSFKPDGASNPYWLSSLGGVPDLSYSDAMPGGALSLTCTLQYPPALRHEALDPGRIVRVYHGGSIQWEGIMNEPVPADSGWQVQADGAGTWGDRYRAVYAEGFPISGWGASSIIDAAISSGLKWIRGSTAGAYLGPPQASASLSITEFMNLLATPVSLTWRVQRVWAGLQVNLMTIPTAVTRLLITTVPAARTLAGYVNVLRIRYMISADNGTTAAVYGNVTCTLPDSIARHGRMEDTWDLSGSGVMTSAAAQALGNSALAKYQATSYLGPFTVSHGDYLTTGGSPVDLACEHAGEVVQLILADGPTGGEIYPGPHLFQVGQVAYSAATDTLQVTPFQTWRHDISSILTALAPKAPA